MSEVIPPALPTMPASIPAAARSAASGAEIIRVVRGRAPELVPGRQAGIESRTIAVSSSFINNDSSSERLKGWLRTEAARLGPGQRLPSTRWLIQTHRVSPLTVSGALAELGREGVLVSRPGAGTFVAAQPRSGRPADPADYSWQTVALAERAIDTEGLSPLADPPHANDVISLATGYLHSSLMPLAALRSALARAARLP